MSRIYIFDTTLRDGEQSPGVSLNIQEKLEIAQQLAKLGVDVIEAGFPIASPGDYEAVKAIAKKVKGPVIAALARTAQADLDRAWESIKYAERARIHTFVATSDIHLQYKLKKNRTEVLEMAVESVKYSRRLTPDVEFSAEDSYRSEMDYLCQVITAVIEAGATTINVPDTVGYATPAEYGAFIAEIRQRVPNIDQAVLSVHCHNDLGLAVANSLAAVVNGAQQVECTINGIGERAGNAALEEIVMALHTRKDFYNHMTAINTREIYRASRLVSTLTGMKVQSNKAVVGKNAFAHESGIHQDGVLKERTTYEIMNPEMIGLVTNNIVLGKHSGRHAFKDRMAELGYTLNDTDLTKAFQRFKALADRKKDITDRDLEAIVEDELKNIDEAYRLNYLHISSGTNIIPTATIGLLQNGATYEEAACGSGPVDAAYKAIDKMTLLGGQLAHYALNAVGEGKDALGEVTVKIEREGKFYLGRGVSTDIIEASAKAYLSAINKIVYELSDKDREREQEDNGGD